MEVAVQGEVAVYKAGAAPRGTAPQHVVRVLDRAMFSSILALGIEFAVSVDVLRDEMQPPLVSRGRGGAIRRWVPMDGHWPVALVVVGVHHVRQADLLERREALNAIRLLPSGLQGRQKDGDQDRDDPDDDEKLDQRKAG